MPLTFEQAHEMQDTYTSSVANTREKISRVALMAFVGASGVGKNTNMELVGGHHVGTRTTRKLRPGERNTASYELDPVLRLIELGIPVQYAAIKEFNDIYFSLASDYKPGLNVKDVDRKVVDPLMNAGFAKVLPVGVVAPAREFETRFMARFGDKPEKTIRGRLEHAAETTGEIVEKWCFDTSKLVIVSSPELNTDNTLLMRKFYETGTVEPEVNLRARSVGLKMLDRIQYLQRYYS